MSYFSLSYLLFIYYFHYISKSSLQTMQGFISRIRKTSDYYVGMQNMW